MKSKSLALTVVELRHQLHTQPELSGHEEQTAHIIADQLETLGVDKLWTGLGGHGVLGMFDSGIEGPSVLFRAELDGLPIQEQSLLPYRSQREGHAHSCGHDGHMAILLALAERVAQTGLSRGSVYLLFQPAEETGQGARAVLEDPNWPIADVDYAFAFHNLPGYPLGTVISRVGNFTPTVISLNIQLEGITAHAAEPHTGRNPTAAIETILRYFQTIQETDPKQRGFYLITPIHISMGEENYGISPGEARMGFTMRAWDQGMMDHVKQNIEQELEEITAKEGLAIEFQWLQEFRANINHPDASSQVTRAAETNGFPLHKLSAPLSFGEDFGLFTQSFPGAMFGLGAGEETPPLHHDSYDFPDELIPYGLEMFWEILTQIMGID